MTNPLQAIIQAETPEALHEATIRFYVELSHLPENRPWLALHLPGNQTLREFIPTLQIPVREDWPECLEVRWPTRHRVTGQALGHLHLLAPCCPARGFTTEVVWRAAIMSGYPGIILPTRLSGTAQVVPQDLSPARILPATAQTLLEVFGAVAMPHRFDQMQMLAIRSAHPAPIPNFPKFYWEMEAPVPRGVSFSGRQVL